MLLSFVLLLYAILRKSQALHRKFTSPTVRLLLDSTSPSALTRCHLPYRGEALAFRKVFLPSSKFSSPPEAPLLGELSAKQTERLYDGKPDRKAFAGLNLSVSADAVPPPLPRGGFGIPQSFPSQFKVFLFARGSPTRGAVCEARLRGCTKESPTFSTQKDR